MEDSSDMHAEEGVEILRSSTHDRVLGESSSSNETISKKQITVLVSSGNFNLTQTANQKLALQLLNDLQLSYVTIDGMDAELKAKRDALFEISGIRGNYPQLFLTTSNQGARKTMTATTFLGDYAWLESNSAALVDMVSTPNPSLQQRNSAEFDTRLSALSSEGESFDTGISSNGKEDAEQEDQDRTLTPKTTANIKQQPQKIEINSAPERQVDWIPEEGSSQISDGSFSHAAVRGDDVTETSFTTMTTVGDGGGSAVTPSPLTVVDESGASANATLTNTSGVYVRPITGRNKLPARSPRPPRRMRAVDWCPPQHQPIQPPQPAIVSNDRTRMSNPSMSGITPSVVTSRAVRMADDNTITTFATMTTMGDAGSILEEDMEDEESSSDDESIDGGREGEVVETNNNGVVSYEDSMEEVEDDDNEAVVDKIPKFSNKQNGMAISVTTNQAVRAPDDQSMVTFATMATTGDRDNSEVVDRLPSFTATRVGESVATNETVQIGDHESVATWATMNTMKGQITGNVVDHVPSEDAQSVPSNPNAGTEPGASYSIRTSNAVQDENSITTFTTNATAFTERGIQEVVDKIPTFAGGSSGRSVMSGVTNQAVRTNDDRSTASFATMTTTVDFGSIYETEIVATDQEQRPRLFSDTEYEFDELDRSVVDTIPEATSSVASGTTNHSVRTGEEASVTTFATMTTAGVDKVPSSNVVSSAASATTNHAVRINDDQSVATWATMTTSAVTGHTNEHVVDKTPASTGRTESSIVSGTTDHAIKDREDQSVVTWNTMTTAGARAPAPNAVDKVPSFYNSTAPSISGDTEHAVRAPDDQSVVTFATMTTAGYGRESSNVVDNIPPINERSGSSVVTSDTVQMGDNESVATWATMNTMKGQITGNVVDHVPSEKEAGPEPSQRSVHTSNAVQDERSITTFTTNATAFTERGIQEVVDKIPTFAGGSSGRSVMSGVTNQAVRINDDRSTASFATMTTAGIPFPQDREGSTLVDRIPSFADGMYSVSGRTDAAVKVGDDLTTTTFATLTTAGEATNDNYQNEDLTYQDQSGIDEVMSGSSASRPTIGILKESRHSIKRESSNVTPQPDGADDGGSAAISNAQILRAVTDLRFHIDYRIGELREVNRRDSERVLQIVQQEQARRTALEAKLHSQLLMQSESMVAMELKVLRLEAKIASRDSHRQHRHQSFGGITMDRLPPIAATPSTPNQSDEEADSFEELDLTPRATRSSSAGHLSQMGGGNRGGPTNIAVVTRSGASVASAVTAMSFPDEGFSHIDHAMNNGGSEDGDVEDEGDDNDGSQSTPTQGSRQITNLESILLNPIPVVGSNNDQGISTRATRGDTDGNSSLPTSVTSTTMASTVVTATTRGDLSVGIARIPSRTSASEEEALTGNIEEQTGNISDERPRSRDQSPLTVQSAATETLQSVASASLGPSILSTAAVASSRSFGTRRANAASAAANAEGRSLANRVVSFTTTDLVAERVVPAQENDGGGDSITMPDDLDNLSDIADMFSNSARAWREEYEQRLDAIHKRLDSR